ncbi:ABC transporter ATP-binding protein [Streptomyces roseirectus]|uniref:ABC-type quaternary amine transporter n=1 Tax=Streptomyces roseirectus TaxID=2768066 RepID=A0A7H0IQ44_9ACTN|nr:ABC transporter ATP-binding protein [Streptomyces roseirectus]QNP74910.1 ABC transporter ATP-binding protein [Streptomyces roseirectus]
MKVDVRGLELAYGDFVAIRNLDLTIEDGESVVLLGQSGCGKSSTMRCIAGLETPTRGTISIGDTTVFDARHGRAVPAYRRNVGMVFQSYAVWPHKTVLENVEFPLRMQGVAKGDRRRRSLEVLDTVGLAHLADRGASMLSGGQMQRVALARSMAMSPSVLLLDEPLSNLDARLREDLRVELRRIQVEQGLTSMYVTHDQQEALALADRIAVMQDGRITQLGTPEEIYKRPASASIAAFLGVTNVFEAKRGTSERLAELVGHGLSLHTAHDIPSRSASVCIRPEDVRVDLVDTAGPAPAADGSENSFAGTVDVAVFQGSSIRCKVTTDGGLGLEAVCAPPVTGRLDHGARVTVSVAPGNVMVLPETVPEPAVTAVAA